MNLTEIEWVNNPDGSQGYTWNPITGCLKGCHYCYARGLANGRLKKRYLANTNLPTHDEPDHEAHHSDPFYPRFWESRLGDPLSYGKIGRPVKRKGIFVCDMGELFGDWVPESWQEAVFTTIKLCPWHRFYLLTKQYQNLEKFSPFPDNCWVGVSVTTKEQAIEAGFWMRNVKAGLKFISFEPLLEYIPISFEEFCEEGVQPFGWVIIGCQTKPTVCPTPESISVIMLSAIKAKIPVFIKDNLRDALRVGAVMQEMPMESERCV